MITMIAVPGSRASKGKITHASRATRPITPLNKMTTALRRPPSNSMARAPGNNATRPHRLATAVNCPTRALLAP